MSDFVKTGAVIPSTDFMRSLIDPLLESPNVATPGYLELPRTNYPEVLRRQISRQS